MLSKTTRRRAFRKTRREWPNLYPGKKPRLYLDADVPRDFVDALAHRGLDSVHPSEVGTEGRGDEFHWEEAKRLGRVLVTCNARQFWSDKEYPLKDSPGVVILDTGGRQHWPRALKLLLGFANHLKTFMTGPGAGDILPRSKIRLANTRIVWKMLTYEGRVEVSEEPWGPWW
jgi:predicted nuclease of predicted toxin-antitoxin system